MKLTLHNNKRINFFVGTMCKINKTLFLLRSLTLTNVTWSSCDNSSPWHHRFSTAVDPVTGLCLWEIEACNIYIVYVIFLCLNLVFPTPSEGCCPKYTSFLSSLVIMLHPLPLGRTHLIIMNILISKVLISMIELTDVSLYIHCNCHGYRMTCYCFNICNYHCYRINVTDLCYIVIIFAIAMVTDRLLHTSLHIELTDISFNIH